MKALVRMLTQPGMLPWGVYAVAAPVSLFYFYLWGQNPDISDSRLDTVIVWGSVAQLFAAAWSWFWMFRKRGPEAQSVRDEAWDRYLPAAQRLYDRLAKARDAGRFALLLRLQARWVDPVKAVAAMIVCPGLFRLFMWCSLLYVPFAALALVRG